MGFKSQTEQLKMYCVSTLSQVQRKTLYVDAIHFSEQPCEVGWAAFHFIDGETEAQIQYIKVTQLLCGGPMGVRKVLEAFRTQRAGGKARASVRLGIPEGSRR